MSPIRRLCASLILPALFAMGMASIFTITNPGEILKDASEYDQIARNLVTGQGYAYEGAPTMLREPGYPVFRAAIYLAGGNEKTILWAQVLLVGCTVLLIGNAFQQLTNRSGVVAAWGAACAYGYTIYAASHYSEALTGVLVALVGWLAIRSFSEGSGIRWYVFLVLLSATLILTRMNMAFIPPTLFGALAMVQPTWKKRLGLFIGLGIALGTCLAPWIIRNGKQFNQWTISGRSGIQVYARVIKAREPFARIGANFFSSITSRVNAMTLGVTPFAVEDQWPMVWKHVAEVAVANPNRSIAQVDREIVEESLREIRLHPSIAVKYALWSPVELLHLWAFPSPGSPQFSIEGSFYPAWEMGRLGMKQVTILLFAHILQLIFWIVLGYGLWLGWGLYRWRWIPGWIFLAVTLAHLPFDAIIRYGVPAQPWLWAIVAWATPQIVHKCNPNLIPAIIGMIRVRSKKV